MKLEVIIRLHTGYNRVGKHWRVSVPKTTSHIVMNVKGPQLLHLQGLTVLIMLQSYSAVCNEIRKALMNLICLGHFNEK